MSNSSNPPPEPPFKVQPAERVTRLPPYLFGRINTLLYNKRRAGDDVIDLGMGNPSDPPEDFVIEKLAEAARDPATTATANRTASPTCAAKWRQSTSSGSACGSIPTKR